MNGRVVCVNPPSMPGTTANREGAGGMGAVVDRPGGFLYPPHTLASVAGMLRKEGLEVTARDCVVEGEAMPQAAVWAGAQSPDWLVVQVSWATREADAAFLREARAAIPHAAIVSVGASVPWMENELGRIPGIAWLHGEPESVLGAFLATLGAEASRWQGPLGGTVLSRERSKDAARDGSLEGLPRPAWDLLSWRKYGMLTVVGSKGCNHTCSYCPYVAAQGRRFLPRPVDEIADEMAYLAEEFKPARVVFRDPVFALQRDRVLALCGEIAKRRLRLAWECESRADDLDAEMVAAMAKAGCTSVKLGLESADARVLAATRRVRDAAHAEVYQRRAHSAAATCRDNGIACRVFVMTGLAGETDQSIDETIACIGDMRPAALHVKVVEWHPGTDMDARVDAEAEKRAQRLRESFKPVPAAPKAGLLSRIKRRIAR